MKPNFNSETLKNLSFSPVDICFIILLTIPVFFSILQAKLVKFIGYLIFVFGSISPEMYEKTTKQLIPHYVKSLMRGQIVLHSIFGQYLGFYNTIVFWDKLLHFLGCFVVTVFFYYVLSRNSKFWKAEQNIRRATFEAFLLANFAGIVWEIAEFVADMFFKVNAQRGLEDTMFDLIFNLFGAFVASRVSFKFGVNHSIKLDDKNGRRYT